MSARCSRLVFAGVCVLAMFAPLAFGAVETWARAILLAMSLPLVLVWMGDAILRGRLRLRRTLLYLPLAGFLAWSAAQVLLDRTLYRHATREELVWATGLALVWVVVLNALNPPELRRLPLFFSWLGFALALFAILQGLAAPQDTIYWIRELSYGPTAYGSFVNKNHYAGYMELLAPLPVALAAYGAVGREQRGLFYFLGLVMMVSVVLSLSRTGAAILALEVLLLTWLARSRNRPRTWVAAALVAVLVAAGAVWLGGKPLVERLSTVLRFPTETSLTARFQVARDALGMMRDYPLWGTGLATFGDVYPRYKTFEDGLFWDHAHNDLLELGVETGIVGIFCAVLFLAGLRTLWKAARGRSVIRDPFQRAVSAGVFVGCIGLGLHSLLDFHFHIPATALTFAILYALGLALAHGRVPAPQG